MGKIDVHADDFGESLHASRDILDCLTAGKLDSISVLSNMGCFEQCVALYREREKDFPKKPLISVHLNFMEGSCLERPKRLPSLVDGQGHFSISWGKLFLSSWMPGRKKLKEQLKREMKLQIEKVRSAFPEMKALVNIPSTVLPQADHYLHQADIIFNDSGDVPMRDAVNSVAYVLRRNIGLDTEDPQLWEDEQKPQRSEQEVRNIAERIKSFLGLQ